MTNVESRLMDTVFKGHPYIKSALDMACWDILGKATNQPVCTLLGGRYGEDFHLYRAISQEAPDAMASRVADYRSQGYRRFQLKVGGNPEDDIARIRAVAAKLQPGDRLIADANTGWLMHDAMRVVRAVRDIDVYIEQPCLSYEECLAIRRRTDHPFVLDEVIDGIDVLVKGHADGAMDVVNLKISKFGGLTKTKQARDLCVSLGIAMTLDVKSPRRAFLVGVLGVFACSGLQAQTEAQWVTITYVKTEPGKAQEFRKFVETNWKKLAQVGVDEGRTRGGMAMRLTAPYATGAPFDYALVTFMAKGPSLATTSQEELDARAKKAGQDVSALLRSVVEPRGRPVDDAASTAPANSRL
jgi:hypothetical protein